MILSAYRFADGVEPAPDAIAAAAAALRNGSLVGLPTETVYGLGADAENAQAIAQIFFTKGRPADHPLIVHVASFDGGMGGVSHFAQQVPAFAQQLMAAFWPGPLTLILPRKPGVAAAAAGGQESIGLRCPQHAVAQEVLAALRKPQAGESVVWGIAAPSANRFGRVSPTTAEHVHSEFGDSLLVLDGGACAVGIESTLIDCTRGAPVLLRPGAITAAQVEAACGRALLTEAQMQAQPSQTGANSTAPRASGTLESHYAPNARVRLMDARELQAALDLLPPQSGAAPVIAVYARSASLEGKPQKAGVALRRMPADAAAAAHELFAVLRALDGLGVRLIWVETPPSGGAWDGVRDRLQRAAA